MLVEQCAQGLFGTGCFWILLYWMLSLIFEGNTPELNCYKCTCFRSSEYKEVRVQRSHRTHEEGGFPSGLSEVMIKSVSGLR